MAQVFALGCLRLVVAQQLGDAPVHDLNFPELADHHVARLQIAMDHAAPVREGNRLAYLLENAQKLCLVISFFGSLLQQQFPT